MRILAATSRTNGDVAGDYHHCVEGELVYMQDPCAGDRRDPDRSMRVRRGFAGTNSHRATSTAVVVPSTLTLDEVDEAVRSSLEAGGWLDPSFCTPALARGMVRELVDDMQRVAHHFDVGTVVRRRIDHYFEAPRG